MQRRNLIKTMAFAAAGAVFGPKARARVPSGGNRKKVLTVAHITDVHLRPEYNAPERYKRCLEMIKKDKVDLILNGGDSIYAADYDNITKDRVLIQWKCWHDAMKTVKGLPVYSVLGNHDMWWHGKGDALYGKPGVLKMLGLKNSYYSINKGGWHFIMLDSNHPQTPGMLDEEQWAWFVEDVQKNAHLPTLIMSHYPLLSCTGIVDNKADFVGPFKISGSYNHLDIMKFVTFFNQHKNIRLCLSGHIHLLDRVVYNDVHYLCNGATSGFWWEPGDDGRSAYKQTSPGYTLLDLYDDGSFDDKYILYENE